MTSSPARADGGDPTGSAPSVPDAPPGVGSAEPPDREPPDREPLQGDHEDGPRAGRAARLAGGVVPLLLGLVAVAASLRLGVGDPRDPGPGLWPLLASLAIVACAVTLLMTERGQHDYEKYTRGAMLNMLGIASLVAYALLMPAVGFEVVTVVVSGFWLKVLGGESWRTTIIMSVGLTAALYVLFILLLGAPLPRLLAI